MLGMQTYFSTFITGFNEVVEQALKKYIRDVEIELLSDGIAIYKTSVKSDAIKQLRFFNNSFLLLKFFSQLEDKPIDRMLKQTIGDKNVLTAIYNALGNTKSTFRIMATVENQFVAMDKNLKEKLEKSIAQRKTLRVDRSDPENEFLFMVRSEGFGLF